MIGDIALREDAGMKYAAESLPFHDVGLETALGAIKGLGFNYVNLWSSEPPLAHHVDVGGDSPESVGKCLEWFGLRPCGLTMYGKSEAELRAGIEFAGRLGAGRLIFDCEAPFKVFVGSLLPGLLEVADRWGVDICVENHLTVPFTPDFERGGHEEERWEEGVDSFSQIKRLCSELPHPRLKVCLAPSHLWVMDESICAVADYLIERGKLGYYYIWDVSGSYVRGRDGLNFGPGEEQLPRPGGSLDHGNILGYLNQRRYDGFCSLKCHGTAGWSLSKVQLELQKALEHLRACGVPI